MLRLKAVILAYRIEYHWLFVSHYRKKMQEVYDKGEPLSSPAMLRINDRLSRHAVAIMKAEKKYEEKYFPLLGGVL